MTDTRIDCDISGPGRVCMASIARIATHGRFEYAAQGFGPNGALMRTRHVEPILDLHWFDARLRQPGRP
jgi:hypothetical protein